MRNIPIKTHVSRSIFFSENRAIYENICKNMIEPDRPDDNIVRSMRLALCVTKAIDTHSEYAVLSAFTRQ